MIKLTFDVLIVKLWYRPSLLPAMVMKMEQFAVQVKRRNMRELLNDDGITSFASMSNKKVIKMIADRNKIKYSVYCKEFFECIHFNNCK